MRGWQSRTLDGGVDEINDGFPVGFPLQPDEHAYIVYP